MHHIAKLIRHDLELDVPRLLNVFLNIHGVIGKSLDGLHLCILEISIEIFRSTGDTHALSAAARRCLNHHRISDLFRYEASFFHFVDCLLAARYHRHAGVHHGLSGFGFIPHPVDNIRGWADKCDVAFLT